MTAAGLASMYVCLDHMSGPNKGATQAVDRATTWLEERFLDTIEKGEANKFYFLFAVARAGLVSGKRRLGRIDWYQEGERVLLKRQSKADGSWNGKRGKLVSSSFAMLFLTQGRQTHGVIDPAAIEEMPSPAKRAN